MKKTPTESTATESSSFVRRLPTFEETHRVIGGCIVVEREELDQRPDEITRVAESHARAFTLRYDV